MKRLIAAGLLLLGGCVYPGKRDHTFEFSFKRSPQVVLLVMADECRVRLEDDMKTEVVRCYWQTGTGFDTVFEARVKELKYFRRTK